MKDRKHVGHLLRRISWNDIDEKYVVQLIEMARAEDIEGAGLKILPKLAADVTTMTLTPDTKTKSRLAARREMVVCGMHLVPMILKVYADASGDPDWDFRPLVKDGDRLSKGEILGEISGSARVLLQAERIMLNFLQRLSGVATCTAEYVAALGGSRTKLLDTRKTTPCLRVLEKYAFACGGGVNHRMGLFDRVMLKDNHLFAANAVNGEMLAAAVRTAKEKNPGLAVEVEVDSLEQIPPVLETEADVVMLDNFSLENLKAAVDLIGDRAWTEASGGVTLATLGDIGKIGPDFVSSGAPIHASHWIDIGLDS